MVMSKQGHVAIMEHFEDQSYNDPSRYGYDTTGNWREEDEDEDVGDDVTLVINMEVLKASEDGDLQRVKQLLSANPELINCRDVDGYTPLHRACYNNHLDVIEYLLDMGADVRSKSNEGWEPLHSAVHWSQEKAASLLLNAGADINCTTNSGLAPVHLASQQNNRNLLELLLYNPNIDLSLKTEAGETPYEIAYRCSPLYRLFSNI